MNRIHRSAGLGLITLLLAQTAAGQDSGSLESSYNALCSTQVAQQGETCVALRKALAEKAGTAIPGATTPRPQLDRATWGVYADLVGTTMTVGDAGDPVFAKVVFTFVDGKLLEKWTWYGAAAYATSDVFTVERVPDPSQLRLTSSAGTKWNGSVQPDGAVVFSKGSIVGKSEMGYYPSVDGIQRRSSYRGTNTVEHLTAFDGSKEAGYQQMAAGNREQERKEKAAAADARAQLFGAIVSSAAQGYAEYKAQEATQGQPPSSAQPRSTAPALAAAGATGPAVHGANGRPAGGTSTDSGPAQSLRFVLTIDLMPRAGDRVNPTCYSDVITRPGPPGWGRPGFLPPGSAAQAHATVQGLKSVFIAACRASGREITSEGNFHWTWNESRDDDQKMANTRARYAEDVSVSLN